MGWYGNSVGNLPFQGVPLLGVPANHLMIRTVSFLRKQLCELWWEFMSKPGWLDDHFANKLTRKRQTRSECPPKKRPFPKGNESCEPFPGFSARNIRAFVGVGAFFFCLDSVWGVSSFRSRHWNRLLLVGLFPPNCETRNCSRNCLGSRRRFCKSFALGLGVWKNPGSPSKDYWKRRELHHSLTNFCLVGNLNEPKLGTIILIVFDFQGMYIYIYIIHTDYPVETRPIRKDHCFEVKGCC